MTTTLRTLTELQFKVMDAIAHAEHNPTNGATPTSADDVNTWFWADELAAECELTEKQVGGIVTSLQEAGYIGIDIVTAAQRKKGAESGVWFTKEGFQVWLNTRQERAAAAEQATNNQDNAKAATVRRMAEELIAKASGKVAESAKITRLVLQNPKKPGSAAHDRFALYATCATVGEFLARGGTRADLTHDVRKGYISVVGQ